MNDKIASTLVGHVDVAGFDFENRDDREMARLGKKQQLKASMALKFVEESNRVVAKLWLHEHGWSILYDHDHLGGDFDVIPRCNK